MGQTGQRRTQRLQRKEVGERIGVPQEEVWGVAGLTQSFVKEVL